MIANEGEKTVCKVWGITLNYHASHLVNFDVNRAMILEEVEPLVNEHTERKIKGKTKGGGNVSYSDRTRGQ